MTSATQIDEVVEAMCASLRRASDDLTTAAMIIRAARRSAMWESPAGDAAQAELEERAGAALDAAVACDKVAAGLRAAVG
ncbi:hypothetical protein GCM10027064_19590 [Microbacterium petrolearium]